MTGRRRVISRSAARLLTALAEGQTVSIGSAAAQAASQALIAADLACRAEDGGLALTPAGHAHWMRRQAASAAPDIDPFLAQHLVLGREHREGIAVTIDEAESPLIWLARRKGRDGRPLIEPMELMAGERLRADFTRAQMTPRMTAAWDSSGSTRSRRGGGDQGSITEAILAARQRVEHALDAIGEELSGLVLDVCCFLKRLEDIERERRWPPRTAKVVLQLGLVRLARHYGYARSVTGTGKGLRRWQAPDAA